MRARITRMTVLLSVVTIIMGLILAGSAFAGGGGVTKYPWNIPDNNIKIVQKSPVDNVRTFSTITGALAKILDASPTNRYLIKVMPGIYNETINMKDFVDIRGSGQENTKIKTNVPTLTAIQWDVDNATMEDIAVEGQIDSYGSPVIRTVTILMLPDQQTGIVNRGSLQLVNSKIIKTGGRGAVGVSYGSVFVSGCIIDLRSNSTDADEAINSGTGTVMNTVIKVVSPDSSYGVNGRDVSIIDTQITVEATSGSTAMGIESASGVKIQNSEIKAMASNPTSYDTIGVQLSSGGANTISNSRVYSSGSGVVTPYGGFAEINNSTISGSLIGIYNISTGSFRIGSSQIGGGHNGVAGVDKIVNCYDGNYNPIPNQ